MFKVNDKVRIKSSGMVGFVVESEAGWVSILRDGAPVTWTYLADDLELHTTESDPSGKDPHQLGAKLDAGKIRPALVLDGFVNALDAIIKVGSDGAAKYTDNGWLHVPNGFARYSDAQDRHRLKRVKGEVTDSDSGSLHLAHEAWNALAKLELYLRGQRGRKSKKVKHE
jgi:hypothetical protein